MIPINFSLKNPLLVNLSLIIILIMGILAWQGLPQEVFPVVDLDNEIFKKVMDIKVFGSFLCSKIAAKIMIEQNEGGRIINLSSTAGKEGNARMAAYNAANFAIDGFTQALSKELAENKITVN